MNMPALNTSSQRTHPIVLIASTTVVIACLTGVAAMLGWLPTTGATPAAAPALETAAVMPVQQSLTHVAPATRAPVHVAHVQPRAEPARRAEPVICQNCGTVDSVQATSSGGDSNVLGTAGGAVVGGLLGNQVGSGHGREAMTVVGAIGGALAGRQIEKHVTTPRSYETVVHMDNGTTRTVVQATQPEWRDGDHVKIVNGVVRMNG